MMLSFFRMLCSMHYEVFELVTFYFLKASLILCKFYTDSVKLSKSNFMFYLTRGRGKHVTEFKN